MKVTVKKRDPNAPKPLMIHTEFIKLEAALKLANTVEAPCAVQPVEKALGDGAVLAEHSWNMLVYEY